METVSTKNGTFVKIHTKFSPTDYEMVKLDTIVGYSTFTSQKSNELKFYLMFNYPIAGSSHSLEVTEETYKETINFLLDSNV